MEDETKAAKASMQDELKCMLADHNKGLAEQMTKKSCKHMVELAALKQSQMATQNLVTQKTMPTVYDYRVAAQI
jgi:hypothetical protein